MWRVILGSVCIAVCVGLIGCTKTEPAKKDAKAVTVEADEKIEVKQGDKDKTVKLTLKRSEKADKDADIEVSVSDVAADKKVKVKVEPAKHKTESTLKIEVDDAAPEGEITVTVTGKLKDATDGKKDIKINVKKK